jgi:hypothetical protein
MGFNGKEHVKNFLLNSDLSVEHKVENYPVYSNRQNINQFLALHELFKLQANVKGSIVECGVFTGFSLFSFAHFSSIYEPSNYHREVIGFDTFEGFPNWSPIDEFSLNKSTFKPTFDSYSELNKAALAFQKNHYLEEKQKIKLIKGDASKTIPAFLNDNKYFVCSLLYIDLDLYEPTKAAIENFIPRMPKGAVLAFDEIHNPHWPGETQALVDTIGINNLELKCFNFNPKISYAIL